MGRVDAWDVSSRNASDEVTLELPRIFHNRYMVGEELGRGGFGVVRVVTDRLTGERLACKSIPKRPPGSHVTAGQQARHLETIQRELQVLWRLRSSPHVARNKGAYEDDTHIHILMELCCGGALWHRIGHAQYTEKEVARYMRAVLRTVARCHSAHVLHRDIKPGNFLLASDSPKAPLKAIDFGLAVFYDPATLPRTDLGLTGTPWYMAPEVLELEVGPEADVWSAGVMAFQLLSGYLPFDDRSNPKGPSVARIWKAIMTQEPSFKGVAWAGISDDARDFVQRLLNKDPSKRPSAREALTHSWLRNGGSAPDKPLDSTVVHRIQAFPHSNILPRSPPMAVRMLQTAAGSADSVDSGDDSDSAASDDFLTPTDPGRRDSRTREVIARALPARRQRSRDRRSGRLLPPPLAACNVGFGSSFGGNSSGSSATVGAPGERVRNPERAASYRRMFEEARMALGVTRGGSAHAGLEYYRPIDGFPGATTSLGRRTTCDEVTSHKEPVTGHKRPASSAHGRLEFFRGLAFEPPRGDPRFDALRDATNAAVGQAFGRKALSGKAFGGRLPPRDKGAGGDDAGEVCDGSVRGPKSARLVNGAAAASSCCGNLAGFDLPPPTEAASGVRQLLPLLPQAGAPLALATEEGGRRGSAGLYKAFMKLQQDSSPAAAAPQQAQPPRLWRWRWQRQRGGGGAAKQEQPKQHVQLATSGSSGKLPMLLEEQLFSDAEATHRDGAGRRAFAQLLPDSPNAPQRARRPAAITEDGSSECDGDKAALIARAPSHTEAEAAKAVAKMEAAKGARMAAAAAAAAASVHPSLGHIMRRRAAGRPGDIHAHGAGRHTTGMHVHSGGVMHHRLHHDAHMPAHAPVALH